MKRICVFGNYSGRNAGDNALLEGLMEDVAGLCPDVEFHVPTINPAFVERTYGRFHVRAVSLLPWSGSMKILGLPTVRAALGADLVLVTDAILFDRHHFNPLHNYLTTLSYVLPLAARRGVPVALYNAHLGPLTHERGRAAMRRLLRCCDTVILRDRDSLELMAELGLPTQRVALGADCALGVRPCAAARLDTVREQAGVLRTGRPALGVTLSAYLDTFPGRKALTRPQFITHAARMIDELVQKLGVEVVMISSQHMDLPINEQVLAAVQQRQHVGLISNRHYSHNDLAGVIQKLQMHVSMRTHPMIFAASLCVPVISVDANPKNTSFIQSIGLGDYRINMSQDLPGSGAVQKIERWWHERERLASHLRSVIPDQKAAARRGASLIRRHLSDEAIEAPPAATTTMPVEGK